MQIQEALKFIAMVSTDHFIGDIGQPLHVEAVALGGNQISVTCGGSKSNLHSVWDSGIINKLLVAQYNNSVTTWASALVSRLRTGEYNSLAASWLSCTSTTEPLIARRSGSIEDDIATILRRVDDDGDIEPLQCPIVWARDSNSFDCSFVFNFADKQDLCNSTYSVEAIPIIETQVAKQGLRLAAWLNVLFDGVPLTPSSGIPSPF
ncbi:Endonuclease 4 [Psilocybe cubensis]|uniref:Endonuclease 4 n=1 Tax=Psilocybe cubensis TaxID=181762 RepID=A0ACB8GZR0_PSICU|nr:Endonuclease 4 [Psilocybe cubensis]KAH9481018.1 Endonuclease 4 [Psilocybe cubensis]